MKCAAIDIFNSYEKFKKKISFLHNENEDDFNLKFSKDYEELVSKIKFHIDNSKINLDRNKIKKLNLGYSYTLSYKKKYYQCFLDFESYEIKACLKLTHDKYLNMISTNKKIDKNKNKIKMQI